MGSVLVQPPAPQALAFLLRGLGHRVTQHRWFLENPQGAMLESGNPCNHQGSTLCRIKSPMWTGNVLWSSKGLRTELALGTQGNAVHPFLQASPLRTFGKNFTVELERIVGNFSVRVDHLLLVRIGVRSPQEDKRPRNLMTPFLSCMHLLPNNSWDNRCLGHLHSPAGLHLLRSGCLASGYHFITDKLWEVKQIPERFCHSPV